MKIVAKSKLRTQNNSARVPGRAAVHMRGTVIVIFVLAFSAVVVARGESQRRSHSSQGYSHASHGRSHSSARHSRARIKRSARAKSAFKHRQPCPSTGRRSGSCPGYIVDHVRPLECGGADDPSNMQWQTVAAAKAKDRTGRSCR